MPIDLVTNRHKKMQNMSLDDMAHYCANTLKVCCYEGRTKRCPLVGGCYSCWKRFLQETDDK